MPSRTVSSALVVAVVATLTCGPVAAVTTSGSPGVVLTFGQAGLTEMIDALLPVLNKALGGTIPLPDMSLDEHVPVVGHVTLDLTGMSITGFQLPSLDATFAAPDQLHAAIAGLSVNVNVGFRWRKVHWPHLSDHGTLTADTSGGSINLVTSVTSVDGKPHLNVVTSTADFSDFTIHFSGKVAWLYNLIVDLFKNALKDAVNKAVSGAISNALDDSVNKALASLKMTTEIGGGKSRANLDYELVSVNATSSYMAVADLLGVTNNMTGAACPTQPKPLPSVSPVDPKSMIQIILADNFLDCFGWISFDNDAVHERIDHDALPGVLNTTAWVASIPGLAKQYPDMPMVMYMDLSAAPGYETHASGTGGVLNLGLNFSVDTAGQEVHTHRLGFDATLGMAADIKSVNDTSTLFFNLTTLAANVTALQSSVGPIDPSGLNTFLAIILPIVKDVLSGMLAKGIPLPGSPTGLGLINPHLTQGEGYIAVSADFKL